MNKLKKRYKLNLKLVLVGLTLAALVGAALYFKSKFVEDAQIAMVASDQYCQSNVDKFAVQDECGAGTFKSFSVTCKNGQTVERQTTEACYDYFSAYQVAQKICGRTCIAPSPTVVATKVPTPTPVTTSIPTASPRQSPTPVPSAPPACRAQEVTHSAFREICANTGTTQTQYRFLDYTCGDETTPRTIGSAEYCQFGTSLMSGAEFYCRKNACVAPTTTASPAPSTAASPTPTARPGCYLEQTWCAQSLIGGKCPMREVCPSSPIPTATTTPSCLPKPTCPKGRACPAYLDAKYCQIEEPIPTSDPSPLVSCETEIYKLPAKVNPTALSSQMLARYKVNSKNVVAKAGERYAINMKLKNIKDYPLTGGYLSLSAWSSSTLGEASPFNIIGNAASCSVYPDKFIKCGVNQINLNKGQSIRPDSFMVLEVSPSRVTTKMDLKYDGTYSNSPIECSPVTMKVQAEPTRRCYGYGRVQWCRNVVVN